MYNAESAYAETLTTTDSYSVTFNGHLIGRYRTKGTGVEWSYVAHPWSNEHSTIQSLVRRYPAAQIVRNA